MVEDPIVLVEDPIVSKAQGQKIPANVSTHLLLPMLLLLVLIRMPSHHAKIAVVPSITVTIASAILFGTVVIASTA